MTLHPRSKWLAVGVCVALSIFRLWQPINDWMWDDSHRLQNDVTDCETAIRRYEAKIDRAMAADAYVQASLSDCLPADEASAAAIYHKWLNDAADGIGLGDCVVTAEAADTIGPGIRVLRARMHCNGELKSVVDFCNVITAHRPLQKIVEMRIRPPEGTEETEFDVELLMEMVSHSSANQPVRSATELSQRAKAERPEEEVVSLAAMFQPHRPTEVPVVKVQPQTFVKTKPPAVTVAPSLSSFLNLVGVITRGTRSEAVLVDSRNGNSSSVATGRAMNYPGGISATVLSVGTDSILLKQGSKIVELQLAP